jgi:hypothetical protein
VPKIKIKTQIFTRNDQPYIWGRPESLIWTVGLRSKIELEWPKIQNPKSKSEFHLHPILLSRAQHPIRTTQISFSQFIILAFLTNWTSILGAVDQKRIFIIFHLYF